jgi:hypothetical protein
MGVVYGDEQGAKPPESSRQLKLTSGSLDLKRKVGLRVADVEPSAGPAVIVASGAFVSTVNERDRSSLSFPAASIAWTDMVCAPSGSGVGV